MSPSPGEVVDDIMVDLPRPRPIMLGDAPEFGAYVDRIHRQFERNGHSSRLRAGASRVSTTSAPTKVSSGGDGFVAEIMLANGPLNLVTRDLLRDLNRIIGSIARDQRIRCVILHGGDARAFCAGSDMKEFAEVAADASEKKILFEDMVLRKLARLPSPTIAAIDGPALGGGFEWRSPATSGLWRCRPSSACRRPGSEASAAAAPCDWRASSGRAGQGDAIPW